MHVCAHIYIYIYIYACTLRVCKNFVLLLSTGIDITLFVQDKRQKESYGLADTTHNKI